MTVETGLVTTKGQVVIPARLRRRLGIKRGTRVAFLEVDGRMIIQPLTRRFIDQHKGMFAEDPAPLRHLLEERKRERVL